MLFLLCLHIAIKMQSADAGRKLKLQEERNNYSGPAASHLKTTRASGFGDVAWIQIIRIGFSTHFINFIQHFIQSAKDTMKMLSVYSTQRSVFVIRSALEVQFRSQNGWTRWTGLTNRPGGVQLATNCHECACKEAGTEPWSVNPKRSVFSSSEKVDIQSNIWLYSS